MKFAEKHNKLYEEIAEESFAKWGYYYPPRTWDELSAWNTKSFEKYLTDIENGVKKTKSYVSLFDSLNEFGFYDAFQKRDYGLLNNVIYQTSRHKLLNSGMLASGTDHCDAFFNVLNSFSCNDFAVIDSFFPKELPQSKGSYYTEISVNLLKVLYFKQFDLKDEAFQKADKFLLKKITAWEKYVILYFKALINKNELDASNCLIELCAAYQKMNQSVSKLHNKLAKCFASEIHGLYRFAKVIDDDLFKKITRPEHKCFSEEFELWQKDHDFPKGKLFYKYPERIDFMNKILEAEIPTVSLHKPYPNKKETFKDVDKFLIDLTENAGKLIKSDETTLPSDAEGVTIDHSIDFTENVSKMSKYDDATWHANGEGFPINGSIDLGATHIGMFMKWCILNDLHSDELEKQKPEEITAVREGKMTGRQFILQCLDGVLMNDDLNEVGNSFTADYYNENTAFSKKCIDYHWDYSHSIDTKGKNLNIYSFADSVENYEAVARTIDRRFYEWEIFNKIRDPRQFKKEQDMENVENQFAMGEFYTIGYPSSKQKKTSFEWFLKSAEQGHKEGQYRVGLGYLQSIGAKHNPTLGCEWLLKSAEQGVAIACYYLGQAYNYGSKGIAIDKDQAIVWYEKARKGGIKNAQYQLDLIKTKEQDQKSTFEKQLDAANTGNAIAQFELAQCYDFGIDTEENKPEAVKWYLKSAEQENSRAQYLLALRYDAGTGIDQDSEKAVFWYTKSAKLGDMDAQFNLGVSYATGDGVEQDSAQAFEYYLQSARQGNSNAQYALAHCYLKGNGTAENEDESFTWFKKAAEQENMNAAFYLASSYHGGIGTPADENQAYHWYKKCAEDGHEKAQFRLGQCYEVGIGVDSNIEQAKIWYAKSAEQGNEEAKIKLSSL